MDSDKRQRDYSLRTCLVTKPMTIMNIEQQLERDEGCELAPYPDPRSALGVACAKAGLRVTEYAKIENWQKISGMPWTGGVGHSFGVAWYDEIPQQFRPVMTVDQKDGLFAADLHHVYDLMDLYIPWWAALDGNLGPRSGMLLNAAFNLGVKGLAQFHGFLALMRAKDWNGAAADLRTTAAFHQLPQRYERLAQQITSGVWQ